MARVVKLPAGSALPPNARGSFGGGQCYGLSCVVMPMRAPSRASRPPAVARAVAKKRPEAGDNAASLQNLLGLASVTGQRKARETRTTKTKQLQKPELPSYSYDTAGVATVLLQGSQVLCFLVPAKCPKNIHWQLSMVDMLEKIGISGHFAGEIKSILDVIYSCWLQRDEEIMLDMETCAMAFRILRMNGYDVSSDDLSHVAEASSDLSDTRALLELYKASQVSISDDELILESIGSWSGRLLKERLSSSATQRTPLLRDVEHALNSPFYATLDRLEHKRNIEQFDAMEYQMQKTAYLPYQTIQDFLALGARDFSTAQSIYEEELQHLDSWVKQSRLDQLPFARQKLAYFYLSAAGTIFPPELSDARILWAKNGVLTTVVDDFFDVGGSQEELENLTALVEMWHKHENTEYYSEQVEIVFSAIYSSVNQLGAKASAVQGRDVTGHLVEIWQELLRSMVTEVQWRKTRYVPTLEEYMQNAVVTFALGPIVLPALYLVGPEIKESVVRDPEYIELFSLMSACGRLLNDVQTYEREYSEGKLNSVLLLVLHSGGTVSIEEARREMQRPIDTCRRELLRLVLRDGEGGGAVPGPCKELFWKMCKTCYFFYSRGDAFSSLEEKAGAVDAVIHEPLHLASDHLLATLMICLLLDPREKKKRKERSCIYPRVYIIVKCLCA